MNEGDGKGEEEEEEDEKFEIVVKSLILKLKFETSRYFCSDLSALNITILNVIISDFLYRI